jgi:signal transduction histidine kinase
LSLVATLSRPPVPHLLSSRVRAALDGLGLLAGVLLLMIFLLSVNEDPDFKDFTSITLPSILLTASGLVARHFSSLAGILVPPLPLAVLALNLAPSSGAARIVWVIAVATLYAAACSVLCRWIAGEWGNTAVCALPIFLVAVFEFRSRAARSASDLMRRQIDASAMDAELTRARLQMLCAQIEPHFLFNTLANVRRMAHDDQMAAAEAIGHLIRYLEAALPGLRSQECLLSEERKLIAAYLSIHQMRMGLRLDYSIDIPDSLADIRVPSMMLITLIENAIKHGVSPLSRGGHVEVRARAIGASVELSVSDTGRGVGPGVESGSGTGLANIRARLNLQYGSAARLTLSRRAERGTTAVILLPREGGSMGQVS